MTSTGYLLIFPLNTLPQLSKGKGNKLISMPRGKEGAAPEIVSELIVLTESDELVVHVKNKTRTLKLTEWKKYIGERARRGSLVK
jgi:topoisomerase-4 subunit A